MPRPPLALACTILFFASLPAHADWPAMRHDARRSARGTGTSQIDAPAVSFRRYLGGALSNAQYVAHDVNGDGAPEVLLVVGGALVAKTPRDVIVWETPALDITSIAGLVDLDGDASPEVVCPARAGRLHVIDPRTGTVAWTLPAGVVGNVGAVRFADLDTAPGLDLYVADAACGSTGSLGDVGRGYSFAAGLSAPTMLFELARGLRDYVCGQYDVITDIDGDGVLDVIAEGVRRFYVYSTVDGHLISTSEDVGSIPYGLAQVFLTQADADAAPEMVCFTDNTYAAPTNSRRVFLMDWDAGTSMLMRRWEHAVTDLTNDRHGWYPGGVEDLGGDGRVEVVTSFYHASTSSWTTHVYDVRDGSEITMLGRGPFRGLSDLDGDGTSEVLVGDALTALGAYRFSGTTLARIFLVPAVDPVYQRERDPRWPSAPIDRPVALDLDADGRRDLLVIRQNADRTSSLLALSTTADPPPEIARLDVEADVALLSFQPFSSVTRPILQPLVARSDGYLWVLDAALQPTNANLTTEIPERGLRIGGYYSGPSGISAVPIAADLDGDGADDVIVRDSRGVLLRLDARAATLISAPVLQRELRRGYLPVAADLTGDGRPELVVGVLNPMAHAIVALRDDGTELWRATVGTAARGLTGDLIAGDVSGDGTPDIVYHLYSSSGGTVIINALDGLTGTNLWATSYETVVAGSGLGVAALADRNADGRLDVLATPRNLLAWLSAVDGTQVASVAANYPGAPIVHDVDGDGSDDIMASGTVYGTGLWRMDLTNVWTASGTLHTRVMGALATCAGGPRYVEGHINSSRVSVWDARSGAVVGDLALLDGRVWEPPSSAPDLPGVVGNVTVAPDLVGDGTPTVLVPSSDGHLYALDPCTLVLRWALDLRYPVGEAILADPDGDGQQEILVTAADGFLYGVDREVLPRPAYVYENGGTGIATTAAEDVDELITTSRLWANWASVPGATAYEYAVITPGGTFVTVPEFVPAGSATAIETADLPLGIGQRYLFAVRAIGPTGSSREAISDGVVVLEDPCVHCVAGQICVDHACVLDPCAGVTCTPPAVCVMGACERADAGVAPGADAGPGMADAGRAPSTGGGCCSAGAGLGHADRAATLGLGLLGLALALRRRR